MDANAATSVCAKTAERAFSDGVVRGILAILRTEEKSPMDSLFLRSLGTMLSIHLARGCGGVRVPKPRSPLGG